jgi:DNA-directed RNA polymerase specialized sigma24 family protein
MGEPVCSRDEVVEAIRALSTANWNRLRRVAIVFCRGRPIEADDLVQETFARAIDGSRNCPRNVDIVRFLTQAMRSIASSTTKVLARQPEFRAVSLFGDDGLAGDNGLAFDPPDGRPTAEQQAISGEDVAQIKRATLDLFQDDLTAQVLVEGMMEGMDGEDLRATTGLSKVGFASKRRLVRRRLDKAPVHDGRKP